MGLDRRNPLIGRVTRRSIPFLVLTPFRLLLGEDEDGRLWVYGVGEDGITAFTQDGIEILRQIIVDERTAGRAPPSIKPAN